MSKHYDASTEEKMKNFYESLSEKDRRRYAAIEAMKLPYGGKKYIAELFSCDHKTLERGLSDLEKKEELKKKRVRESGGGRKSIISQTPEINDVFLDVVKDRTAGSPQKEGELWTDLSDVETQDRMAKKGTEVSKYVVKKLYKDNKFKKRKIVRRKPIGKSKNRNAQFENISKLKEEYKNKGNPVVSCDAKKKELLGALHRSGTAYSQSEKSSYDHDFNYLAEGLAIPYGVYDIFKNEAHIFLGTTCDTSEFATDAIEDWWISKGRHDYPGATSLLVLADGGGSNSSRFYVFKEALQKLANRIGVEIRIAHYPPYTSKWNPIEHRVFPHITRSMQGVMLRNYEHVKELIEKTKTKKGLKVTVNIAMKIYTYGKKIEKGFKENMKLIFDNFLGAWNYRAVPHAA